MSNLIYKTAVYRAIYYSGFEWTKINSTKEIVDYKLISKKSGNSIYLTQKNIDNNDIIIAKTTDTLTEADLNRFSKLVAKIGRRTKDLKVEADFIDIAKPEKEGTNDGDTND